MEAKNIQLGDEIYYLSRDRRTVVKGVVSSFRYSQNERIVGIKVHNHWQPLTAAQVLGPAVALEERPLVE
jgi:hypothetical protein